MLLLAAALLYSSVHLFGATGESPAPENLAAAPSAASVELAAPIEGHPAGAASLADCRDPAASAAKASPQIDAPRCLAQLGRASPHQLTQFSRAFDVDAGDDLALAAALGQDGSPLATATWWAELSADQRSALIESLPSIVGNLEGVPYDARDQANRRTLLAMIGSLRHRNAAPSFFMAPDPTSERLTMLEQVQSALTPGRESDDAPRTLVSLDTVFPGRAAVAVGDLDTADDVSIMVPGMLYTVSHQLPFWTDRAAALHSEQTFWASNLVTRSTGRDATSAVVAWMGYRTPDLTNVLSLDLARAGAVHLENAMQGLDAVRHDDAPRVSVVAHSYGSTTASIALSSGTVHADSFVVLGSPGSVVPRAADLAVSKGQVYAAAAALDPVAGSGFFGQDPGASAFGATVLAVGAGTDPFTELHLTGSMTHNDYFVPGSQSMRNLALVDIGRGDLARGRRPQPVDPNLGDRPTLALVRPQDVDLD